MPARRHSRDAVIEAALTVLDEKGLEAVTVREIARRMRVNLNTVSFQVGTKANLIDLMADAVFAGLSFSELPDEHLERVAELLRRTRIALLSHRDGAKLVTGTKSMEHNTMRLSEEITSALLAKGVSEIDSVRAAWGMFYFALGLTQEQQAATTDPEADAREIPPKDYPTLSRLGHTWTSLDFDDRFEFGIAAFLNTLRENVGEA